LGETKNDYSTTTGATFKFDPYQASKAKGVLEDALKNDLRATHYKLGYQSEVHQTTHQSTYVPLALDKRANHDPNLRKSHFDLNSTNKNILEGQSIYMTDYTKKEIVDC
jgi:hypothetical protein